jgi:hypothetical protein
VPYTIRLRELAVGIDGDRVTDVLQQRQILDAVRIEVALPQPDTMLPRKLLRREPLVLAETGRAEQPAGEPPVRNFYLRADDMSDAEAPRQRFDLVARRRTQDDDRVALLLMRMDHRADFGVDLGCEMLARHFIPEVDQLALGQTLQVSDGRRDCGLEIADVQQLLARDLAVAEPLQEHLLDGMRPDDRAIEIEERSNGLAAHARGNFAGKVLVGLHRAVSVCRCGRRYGCEHTMTQAIMAFNT